MGIAASKVARNMLFSWDSFVGNRFAVCNLGVAAGGKS
jgi:hypothetical protein